MLKLSHCMRDGPSMACLRAQHTGHWSACSSPLVQWCSGAVLERLPLPRTPRACMLCLLQLPHFQRQRRCGGFCLCVHLVLLLLTDFKTSPYIVTSYWLVNASSVCHALVMFCVLPPWLLVPVE